MKDEADLRSELQTQLELRLRMIGLKVQDRLEASIEAIESARNGGTPKWRAPYLVLRIEQTPGTSETLPLVAFHVGLGLYEQARLQRDETRTLQVITWMDGHFGYCAKNRLGDNVTEYSMRCIDSFRNAWLKANPKKEPE